ncbi:MAG: asparaginase [Pseudomonadota bacterium]
MTQAEPLVEIWRGPLCESAHAGHVVVCDAGGAIVEAWGDPDQVIFPRSSCKMLQALPLIHSGAAAARGLGPAHLALACASHEGAALHRVAVEAWLGDLGLGEPDLRCGVQAPSDVAERDALIRAKVGACQVHNNCSGKHAGFLTLSQHLGGDAEYLDIAHPVQRMARNAFEEATGADSAFWATDGCSAPNFSTTVHGLARAMGRFAGATDTTTEGRAMVALREAMMTHPDLVAGEGRACTELMRAAPGVAVKTGAEGVYVAIIPERRLGIALKITDGTTRAAEAVITRLLIRLGLLDAAHPAAQKRLGPIRNWRGIQTGHIAASAALG